MPDQIFTVEIHETWVKKIKVSAYTRVEAIAKAKAQYISDNIKAGGTSLANDPDAVCRETNFQLEFPDGNPE